MCFLSVDTFLSQQFAPTARRSLPFDVSAARSTASLDIDLSGETGSVDIGCANDLMTVTAGGPS